MIAGIPGAMFVLFPYRLVRHFVAGILVMVMNIGMATVWRRGTEVGNEIR